MKKNLIKKTSNKSNSKMIIKKVKKIKENGVNLC